MAGNTPLLSSTEEAKAPWNENFESITVPVTITLTLSKTVNVDITNYNIQFDTMGNISSDYSEEDLREAVKDQIILPQEDPKYKDWEVESMEVEEE